MIIFKSSYIEITVLSFYISLFVKKFAQFFMVVSNSTAHITELKLMLKQTEGCKKTLEMTRKGHLWVQNTFLVKVSTKRPTARYPLDSS